MKSARVVAVAGAIAATALGIFTWSRLHKGPPARLVAGTNDTVIVNSERSTSIPVRVFDARGHELKSVRPQFHWRSGAPIQISERGDVRCREMRDALVQLSLGEISQSVLVRCQPIRKIVEVTSGDFIIGDSATPITISALGPDDKPVQFIAASAVIRDRRIASLEGAQLLPKKPGLTEMTVTAGDQSTTVPIMVFDRGDNLATLNVGQIFIASLEMESGESRRWPISPGRYLLSLENGASTLRLGTDKMNCVSGGPGQQYMCVALANAGVAAYASKESSAQKYRARLSVIRLDD